MNLDGEWTLWVKLWRRPSLERSRLLTLNKKHGGASLDHPVYPCDYLGAMDWFI